MLLAQNYRTPSSIPPQSSISNNRSSSITRVAAITGSVALLISSFAIPVSATSSKPTGLYEETVTVIPLTDQSGEVTELASVGVESIQQGTGAENAPNAVQGSPGRSNSLFSANSHSTSPQDVAILTEPILTDDFLVAGLAWDASETLPEEANVFIRVREGDNWSEWLEAEVEDGPDGSVESKTGTEPFITGGASAVQVQVTANPADLPSNLELSLIPENPSGEETITEEVQTTTAQGDSYAVAPPEDVSSSPEPFTVEQQGFEVKSAAPNVIPPGSTVPVPRVVSRAGWGANEKQMKWTPRQMPIRGSVIHHTAGTNNYSASQSPSIVRGIYHYHAVTRGWGDIGYNFLFDKYGNVYEGRAGSLSSPNGMMPQGAHASGFNSNTVGLSAMGDYTKVNAPQVIFDRMASVLAWQFAGAGIKANERSGFVSPGTAHRAKGQNLPRIFAHRDVGATACPGNQMYSKISSITSKVDSIIKKGGGVVGGAMPTQTTTFYLNNDFDAASDIVFRYGQRDMEHFIGDWNGDGMDTVAMRHGATFYVNNSNQTKGYDRKFVYGRPGDDILVGDWNGNGVDTFAVRRGKEFHIKNSISGGHADHVIAYGRVGDDVLVGDWNGDRKDTLAVRRGIHYHVKNSIRGGDADVVATYGRANDEVFVGDYNGNKQDTLAVRRGTQIFVKNRIASGNADFSFHYGRVDDTVFTGDWTGRGRDTFGIRRD